MFHGQPCPLKRTLLSIALIVFHSRLAPVTVLYQSFWALPLSVRLVYPDWVGREGEGGNEGGRVVKC